MRFQVKDKKNPNIIFDRRHIYIYIAKTSSQHLLPLALEQELVLFRRNVISSSWFCGSFPSVYFLFFKQNPKAILRTSFLNISRSNSFRDLTHVRRRRCVDNWWQMCFYFMLEFRIYLELSGAPSSLRQRKLKTEVSLWKSIKRFSLTLEIG